MDALKSSSSIRFILVHHEHAASFMADMYGRVGPGAINLILGTADAFTDSVPLIALSAQVGLHREYKETRQFVDLTSMFRPITKWAAEIRIPSARNDKKSIQACSDRTSWPLLPWHTTGR
jgi:acetolactate synthase-1/2/3 large subunit